MKKFLSMFIALAMMLSLVATSYASDISDESHYFSAENLQVVEMEKVVEDDEFVYFSSEIECEITENSQISGTSAAAVKPILATLTTAVNKVEGKIGFTIAIHPEALVSTAVCSSAQVSVAMGYSSEFNLEASNFIPMFNIYINHIFDGLKTNIETGYIYVTIGTGTFSGPFGLTGTFGPVQSSINLADC